MTPQVIEQEEILAFCKEPHSKAEIMQHCGYQDTKNFTQKYLRPLLESGKLQMTIPDKAQKPTSKVYDCVKGRCKIILFQRPFLSILLSVPGRFSAHPLDFTSQGPAPAGRLRRPGTGPPRKPDGFHCWDRPPLSPASVSQRPDSCGTRL